MDDEQKYDRGFNNGWNAKEKEMEEATENMDKVEVGNTMKDGQLKVESKCEYGQTVYFLDSRRMHSGKCIGVKGEDSDNTRDVEILIYESAGHVARDIWIPEEDCYFNREELLASLLGVEPEEIKIG